MEELNDLKLIAENAVQKLAQYKGEDFILPQIFKEEVKEINGCSISYNKYSAIIETSGQLNIYMPNQWFFIASYFTELYNELFKYKKAALSITTKERLKELNGKDLTEQELRNIEHSGFTDDSKENLKTFITNYTWWGGAKTIDRGDFYVSPILSYGKLVNASQSYVAELCAFLADKERLVSSLKNEIETHTTTFNRTRTDSSLLQIYFGAPGTGKSHAVEEITNKNNSIRTTFHPDSDYSTFVGCYKPMQKVGKQISTKISLEKLKEKATEIINQPAGEKVEQIIDFISLYAERLCEIVEEREDVKSLQNLMNIHFGFSNETYLSKMILKVLEERKSNSNEITYAFQPQAFTQAYVKAWQNLSEPFYLVIEEINRGNCAQIFGDIFQLLDRDSATGYSNYKITPDQDLQMYLAKEFANTKIEDEEIKTGTKMQLPGNLHILATMNTSDQSLFPIDSAFKRRWDWKYIPIDYTDLGHYIICGDKQYKWTDFLAEVNQRIEAVTQSEDKKLGAWFVKAVNNEISAEKFVSKVVFYLWNDIYKDLAHDASTIFKGNYDKFHKFFDFKGDVKLDILNEFLLGLNLTSINNGYIPDVSEADDNNTSAKKKFTLNGTPMYLGDIAQHVVQTYAQNHPNENSQTIRDTFVQWCPKITSIVETEEEYNIRKAKNTTTEGRSSSITLSNGEVLYITKQWSAKRPTDNFFQFMQVCQNNNLGDIKPIEQ